MTRLAVLLFAGVALSACSIWAPSEEEAPTPVAAAPVAAAPNPASPVATQPAPPPAAASTSAAQGVAIATPPPRRPNGDDEVIVRGQQERQVQAPPGDPRSVSQRMQDIRAWDQCVMHAQNVQSDPTRPSFDTPEDICRRSLGMHDRTAVPDSRRP